MSSNGLDTAFLERLLDATGPSGFEVRAARVWRQEAESLADEVTVDVYGNSFATLQPDGALELAERPLQVETAGALTRGATVTDWNRQTGRPDKARILLRYDQARFEGLVEAALAAG